MARTSSAATTGGSRTRWWSSSRATARAASRTSSPGRGRRTTSCRPRSSERDVGPGAPARAADHAARARRPRPQQGGRPERRHHALGRRRRPRLRRAARAPRVGRDDGAPGGRVIYLYAIAEELAGLPDVRGVDGAPLDRRAVEGLDLVVSEHDGAEIAASEEAVLAHARVVEGLVGRSAALLPARFGRGFRDETALREAIEGRTASLRDALAQVRGCVEVGVRVLAAEPTSPPAAESGRAYMEARLARSEETERLARGLHEPLAALARAATRTVRATPR